LGYYLGYAFEEVNSSYLKKKSIKANVNIFVIFNNLLILELLKKLIVWKF